jgi:hypothetical protein
MPRRRVARDSAKALASAAPIGSVVLKVISGTSCSSRADTRFAAATGWPCGVRARR